MLVLGVVLALLALGSLQYAFRTVIDLGITVALSVGAFFAIKRFMSPKRQTPAS